MKFLERIKQILFGNKIKAISSGTDVKNIITIIKKEKNHDVALNILKNNLTQLSSSDIVEIISTFPMNKRVEALQIAKKFITTYDLYELTIKKLDYNGKLTILESYQYNLDLDDIFGIFNNLPPDQRKNALSKCIERFDSYEITELIKKYVPLYERLDCLNLYHEKLDGFLKASIIDTLDSQSKISALKKYSKEINQTNLFNIICNSETSKIPELLDIVYNQLTSKQISDIIQYHISEEKKLESLYKCCSRLTSSTISDLIKYSIPESQKEEALIALQNRIKSNNIGEILQLCIKSKRVLDKVKHNLYEEDIEYFTNNK